MAEINSNNLLKLADGTVVAGQRVIIINGKAHASGVGGITASGSSGSSVDLSVVTATADTILSGYVAVGPDGEIIDGQIENTRLERPGDPNVVCIEPGYVEEYQEIEIPTVSAVFEEETARFVVGEGYIYDTEISLPVVSELNVDGNVVSAGAGYVKNSISAEIPEAAVTETENTVNIGVGYISEPLSYDLSSGGGSGSSSGFKLTCASDSSDVQRTTDGDYMLITESELPGWLSDFRYPGTSVYKRTEFCSVLDSDLYLACSQDEGDYYWYIVSCGLDDDASPCGVITDLNSQTLVAGDFSMYSMMFDEDTSITVEQIGGGGSGGYTKADVIKNVLIFG